MAKNKHECCGELFYIFKKNHLGKPSKIFMAYNTRTWNLMCTGFTQEHAKDMIDKFYEKNKERDI